MKIINLAQRSPEWLKWREGGITASDASTALGISKYKTPWRLWAEKTGRALPDDLSKNPHVARGVENEDKVRLCAEKHLGEEFLLPVCIESEKYPFIKASLDGITEDGIPTEFKCPCFSQWEDIATNEEHSEAYQLYSPQVQHQMFAADEADHGWLCFVNPADDQDYRIFKILRDEEMVKNLITACEILWTCISKNKPPELDEKRDLFFPSEQSVIDSWKYNATEYRLADQQIKDLENKLEKIKSKKAFVLDSLKSLMGDFYHADYAGVSITRFEKRGAIDYPTLLNENVPEITKDDIERYRKLGSTQYRSAATHTALPNNIVDIDIKKTVEDIEEGPLVSMYF
ncbi:MAG: endonuclease [Gammaproteobacteria bacterium]|nr:endonuclease [Gammaproteobacteria bacterium]MBT4194793.1 endonuclease [Gammaproteobacteria bacterium]MBT4451249.1 endonuclease [Gammaproteobacteria bacterium]MBT4859215.1 endonuclease [Gammaproteobacteria bacterium]MBT6454209.1 endonuclease [Gammaproteobacteria bacterium]